MRLKDCIAFGNKYGIISGFGRHTLGANTNLAVTVVCALFSGFYLYTSSFGLVSTESHLGIYFMVSISLSLIIFRPTPGAARVNLLDLVMVLFIIGALIYWMYQYEFLLDQLGWEPPLINTLLGAGVILISLEAARRTTGLIIPAVCVTFLAYAYVGPYLPGILRHDGFPLWRIIEYNFITTEGMLGSITNIFASYIFVFVIFAAFLERSGLGQLFMDTALAVTGRMTGGPGLAACFSSALMGMVSGSPVANVVTTGAFTIPLMKRIGYKPEFAGAVEAAASTGGQYMPPIMGAAAFMLAEFTETPYIEVVKISILPAILYFLAVGSMVYLEARKTKLVGLPRNELPKIGAVLKRSYQFLPIPVIIVLMLQGYSPFFSAVWAIITTVILSWFRKETRMGPKEIFDALAGGAKASLSVGSLVGALGVIMGTCLLTGLPARLSELITVLSGGILPLVVVMIIITGYIIGMGLPATPAYVILALFGVPALAKLGVPALTAHLIVFWVAVGSVLTPPVALASMAAASIADSEPYETGFHAVKLGSWLFLMPFLFLYTPILFNGTTAEIIRCVITALCALIAWAAALEGYLMVKTRTWERILLLVAALGLLHAGVITDIIGVALMALVFTSQFRLQKRMAQTA
ncbi:MAG: TRAP transporter permease [Syntrophales bacterium]